MAKILLGAGDLDAAEREAKAAVATLEVSPPSRAHALAVLAQVLLARGEPGRALEAAIEATGLLESLGGIGEGECVVRLAHAESLAATGEKEAARTAIRAAMGQLGRRSARIRDDSWRASFLGQVPENARVVALAKEWGVEIATSG